MFVNLTSMSPRAAAVRCGRACLVLASLVLVVPAVRAEEPPKQLIEGVVKDALTILRDVSLKSEPKRRLQKLREVADRAFDWEAMAKSSLGAPWRELNDTQRGEFVAVFKELLAQRYMNDIDRFQGSEELTVGNAEKQDDFAIVKTTLITSSRESIPIDYTLRLVSGRWRAQDVTIEGISLVNHYRKTFTRFLSNKSFAELLQQLKNKLGSPHTAGP